MPQYNNKQYVTIIRPQPNNWEQGIYDIPFIENEALPISLINSDIFLINPNNVSSKDTDKKRKIVHSFRFDEELEKEYDNPLRFIEKISGYYGATSPDFSMHPGMSKWCIIQAVAKSRWFGRYMQSYGIRVYPTVGWVDESTFDICFEGLRDGSTFFISTLGVNNDSCRSAFFNGFWEMRRRFPHSRQICVGQRMDGIPDDVCIIPYEDTFGGDKQLAKRNQMHLFSWDGTILKEAM